MHVVVMESLEEYLSGSLAPGARRAVEAHLAACEKCRVEVGSMREVSQLVAALRVEQPVEPAPGFYARVMECAEARRAQSFAGLFSLDFAFGRRVVFASLLTLAVLGSYLVSRETSYPADPSPEAIMALDNAPASSDGVAERGMMLVTLASYEQ